MEQALGAYHRLGGAKHRPVLIHAQCIRPDQLEEVKKLGLLVSFFAAHIRRYGDIHIQNLGMERAGMISPLTSALHEGVNATLHEDSPVMRPAPLYSVACAVERLTAGGVALAPEEQISYQQAFAMLTGNAAYQYFAEGEKGVLAQGFRADFLVYDKDPMHLLPSELHLLKPTAVYLRGERIV